jgi:hypothetical protein
MKGSLLCALGLASVVLSLGLVGCGGGIEEGMPKDPNKMDHPLTPDMVDVTGKMGMGAAKAAAAGAAKAAKEKKASPGGESTEPK